MRLPPPVRRGDRVGVAALSGPVDGGALRAGLGTLRQMGWEPRLADNLGRRDGLFAGGDDERLEAFHRLAADPKVRAIFFARGGHGVLRLLPRIDWRLLGRRPRAYVGYSDLTPLLNLIPRRLGRVSFHGPMVAVEMARGLDPDEARSLRDALEGRYPSTVSVRPVRAPRAAEGPLMGGCLSLLVSTLGTPWAPRLDGSLLFWEDVDEPLYRLDRMLTHLRLSGTLPRLRGMVAGGAETPDAEEAAALGKLLFELGREHDWPVVKGCRSGHCRPNLTLPLGLPARLRPRRSELVLG